MPFIKYVRNKYRNLSSRQKTALWVVTIFGLAAALRLTALHITPPGLHPDEAANGLDIVERIFKGDLRTIYAETGPGRESLFFFLQAVGVAIFGNTIFALRVMPALIGSLTCVVMYLAFREMFSERTGRIAGILCAILPWTVVMSRNGYRASLMPLIISGTLWAAAVAYRKTSVVYSIGAGIWVGLGLYSYLSYRIFYLAFLVLCGYSYIKYPVLRKKIVYAVTTSVIITMPLVITVLVHPEFLATRSETTILRNNNEGILESTLHSLKDTLGMFFVRGDSNLRHNFQGWPVFNPLLAVPFLAGLIYSVRRPHRRSLLIVLGMIIMLIPGLIANEGSPHFLRHYGAVPFIIGITALGMNYLLKYMKKSNAATALILCFGITFFLTAYGYFTLWSNNPKTQESYYSYLVESANYMNKLPDDTQIYVVAGEYEILPIRYLTWDKLNYIRIQHLSEFPDETSPSSSTVIIDTTSTPNYAEFISPQSAELVFDRDGNQEFMVFRF